MFKKFAVLAAGIAAAVCLQAQDKPAGLAFEVASIKPARNIQEQALSGKLHVGMKIDGARVDIGAMSIADLLQFAYKVKVFQISGPDYMKSERFDILAKLPDGAKEDQVPEMVQALLADRFKLQMHREMKEHSTFALVVAKGGPKLKDAPPDPVTTEEPPKEEKGAMVMDTGQGKVSIKQDGRGGAIVNGGKNGISKVSMENGVMHMEMSKVKMADFAEALSRFVGQTVVDLTELKGNYQVAIDIGMEEMMKAARSAGVNVPMPPAAAAGAGADGKPGDAASEPTEGSLFASLQRMGLKLESRKAPMDTIVVDHVEKAPTEN
jgi:uncharacterized protein (TIGR03435 family)